MVLLYKCYICVAALITEYNGQGNPYESHFLRYRWRTCLYGSCSVSLTLFSHFSMIFSSASCQEQPLHYSPQRTTKDSMTWLAVLSSPPQPSFWLLLFLSECSLSPLIKPRPRLNLRQFQFHYHSATHLQILQHFLLHHGFRQLWHFHM